MNPDYLSEVIYGDPSNPGKLLNHSVPVKMGVQLAPNPTELQALKR